MQVKTSASWRPYDRPATRVGGTGLLHSPEIFINVFNFEVQQVTIVLLCEVVQQQVTIIIPPISWLRPCLLKFESVFTKFPIALQIMLTTSVFIVRCEPTFSYIKLILSNLRASMSWDRLCDQTLMSVEGTKQRKPTLIKSETNLLR